jgi:two-component system sensor kinase FixL
MNYSKLLEAARRIPIKRNILNYLVAILAVGVALAFRVILELFGHFYYLPMVPAVMVAAIVTGRRGPTLLAIGLAITANVAQVQRESLADIMINAGLFVGVCWLIAEMCWRLRAMQSRAADLSRRLERRNRMLDAILASAPVVTLDRRGRILFLTPPACTVLGVSVASAVGRPFADFVETFTLDAAGEAGAGDAVWTGQRPDGQTYPLGIHLGVMADDPEGPHATLSLTDLTQAHAADARARELHAQLNRVWRLNSLGEMAASLAHELNQPLTAAANYLHASQAAAERAGAIGQSAVQTIELAKNQLLRAGAIIRRMRELLAHETRSLGVERVAPMIADMHGVLGMIERNAGVVLEYRIDDLNDRVRAERIQFQQAMMNLIRNAVEALEGQDDRRVRIVGRPTSADHFELTVEDNGRGIDAEALDTIFRPLMTTKSAGMGLGLSVTRTIVESHGGVLTVDRSEMGGAAFSFSLMRERELEDA